MCAYSSAILLCTSIKSLWFLLHCIRMSKRKEKKEVLAFQWTKEEEEAKMLSSSFEWTHWNKHAIQAFRWRPPSIVLLLLCRATLNDISKRYIAKCQTMVSNHLTCCSIHTATHRHIVWHGSSIIVYIRAVHSFFKASQDIVLSNQIVNHVYNSNSYSLTPLLSYFSS